MNNTDNLLKELGKGFTIKNILLRILFIFVTITVFAFQELIQYLNIAGERGLPIWTAIFPAYFHAVQVMFSYTWMLILDIFMFESTYFSNGEYGSIFFGVLVTIASFFIVYNIVSFIMNVIYGDYLTFGKLMLKVVLTIVFLIIISSIIYYNGAESLIQFGFDEITNNVTSNITTSNSSDILTIDLR